jgi:hypothetical protein
MGMIARTIELVMQRNGADCGPACLAMLLNVPYATVVEALPKRGRARALRDEGYSTMQLARAATRLGRKTRYINQGEVFETVGILSLQRPVDPTKPTGTHEGHFVLQLKDTLYNPADGLIWTDIESFLKTRRWEVLGVIINEEDK